MIKLLIFFGIVVFVFIGVIVLMFHRELQTLAFKYGLRDKKKHLEQEISRKSAELKNLEAIGYSVLERIMLESEIVKLKKEWSRENDVR